MKNLVKFIDNQINEIYISSIMLISICFGLVINFNVSKITQDIQNMQDVVRNIYVSVAIFIVLMIMISLMYYMYIRNNINKFCDRISIVIDSMISKKENIKFNICEETITSKVENKLKQLLEIIENDKEMYLSEKDNIKTLISDISHQIKTPIANISMYNETLVERDLNKEQQKLCLSNMKFQVDKLEWLVKCLIKISRLESGVINLNKTNVNISKIIANALGGVYIKAESKNIDIDVACNESISINCDSKWTGEAIFNILENAVKYTNDNGSIKINVEELEIFTRIDIIDNGIGIEGNEVNNIFKRFYRCSEVSQEEGVGVGLYLAREIISKQGGYIKVSSNKNLGTKFSIYLLKD